MLQRGYRVEYSAASDAFTHCPEGFNEFYNQRRRWMPSTTANIFDLLMDYKRTVSINDNISKLYIAYQVYIKTRSIEFILNIKNVGCLDGWNYFGTWNNFPYVGWSFRCSFSNGSMVKFYVESYAYPFIHIYFNYFYQR